jgi:ABC-type dipeptide/oligopeptide/nickel transport system permease subunit
MERTAVHRILLAGLVRIYSYKPDGPKRLGKTNVLHVALNRDIPVAHELFLLLQLIGRIAGIDIPETRAQLPSVAPDYTDRAFDYELLFGPRNKAMTIVIVVLMGFADGTLLGRIGGFSRGHATRILDRIESIAAVVQHGGMR